MKVALLVPFQREYRIFSTWLRCGLLALLGFPAWSQAPAQSGGLQIEGVVVDDKKEPLAFANIALFRSADSVLVTGAVSGIGGEFAIRTDPGRFYARISFLSYEEHIIPEIVIGSGGKDLGVIELSPAQDLLDELIVRGERSTMELYLDKRVFNVGTDLTTVSGSAAEVLANVPSVTVDLEGNVSLRGSGNVRILIDGKPSGLTGINTADALRQVQAELIESVEVITNPSARYDAEGEAGIINIILKKERRRGVNGTFSARIGYPANYLASYNLNLRRDRFNFFSSYGFSYRQGPGSGISYQKYSTPDTTFSFEQFNRRVRGGTSHNLIGGIDYYFSEKSVLTASAIYRLSDGLNTSDFEFRDMGENDELFRTVYRREREEEPEHNAEIALSYRREFSNKDHTLTADFKWIENVETERAGITETDDLGSSLFQRSSNTENERNVFLQADYIAPFLKKGRFESGVRSTLRVIDNDFLVEQQDAESDWQVLPGFDNSMLYTENIYAAYTQLAHEAGRFSYQGGLRGELSDISIALKQSDEVNFQNYFNLFPSAHLAYKLSESRTLQLSYSYRISRPGFRDLLPFSGYGNNRLVMTGNPELRPEYTHSIEGAHLLNWSSGSLLSSAYYRHRMGVIQRITIVDSIGFNRIFPINLATEMHSDSSSTSPGRRSIGSRTMPMPTFTGLLPKGSGRVKYCSAIPIPGRARAICA
jgi:outer membrane receptor protein involved in Fe transport